MMTWKDVSKCFKSGLTEQLGLDTSTTATDQLCVYEECIKGSKKSFLFNYTLFTTTARRKSAASNGKVTHTIKRTSTRVGRVVTAKARKYTEQEKSVINMVTERWSLGDPLGKIELKDEVMSRYD